MTPSSCPLCGTRGNPACFPVSGFSLLRCDTCDLFYIDPYPSDNRKRYDEVCHYTFEGMKVLDAERHYQGEQQGYKNLFPAIDRECRGARSILDVGCGTGHLLSLLGRDKGIVRVGIELNADRAALARKNAGCEIFEVPVEEFATDKKFDVILLINVLSHIANPDKLFASLGNLLAQHGKLIIKAGENDREIRKGDIFDWAIPDHLHFLGMHTMEFIAQKYGFTIVRHERVPLADDMFTRRRFAIRGRSRLRNLAKTCVLYVPFGLRMLRAAYRMRHGERACSSFFVLTK